MKSVRATMVVMVRWLPFRSSSHWADRSRASRTSVFLSCTAVAAGTGSMHSSASPLTIRAVISSPVFHWMSTSAGSTPFSVRR